MKVKIKKMHKDAVVPKYAHEGDAGVDFFAITKHSLKSGERCLVGTGIAMEIPEGYVGLIWDKSGLSAKHGIKVMGGVVDAGYRGEVKVCLFNLSGKEFNIEKGDKIAQMLIQKIENPEIEEAEILSDSERGAAGHGSTGRK